MKIKAIRSNLNPCLAAWHILTLLSLLSHYYPGIFAIHLVTISQSLTGTVSGPDDALEEHQVIALGDAVEDTAAKGMTTDDTSKSL